jgi:DNA invertase Pin-like site-specific DNA recombinase
VEDGQAAWAYCRVSTAKGEQNLSLEQQEVWARERCARDGLALTVFRERASAKRTIGRKEFKRMMSLPAEVAAARRPSLLLVTSYERSPRTNGPSRGPRQPE